MGRGHVGGPVGENREKPQSKLDTDQVQPSGSEDFQRVALGMNSRGSECHENGQKGQYRIDPVEQVHVDLEGGDGIDSLAT